MPLTIKQLKSLKSELEIENVVNPSEELKKALKMIERELQERGKRDFGLSHIFGDVSKQLTTTKQLQSAINNPSLINDEWIDELEVNQAVIDNLKEQIAPSLFLILEKMLDDQHTELSNTLDRFWDLDDDCSTSISRLEEEFEEFEGRKEKLEKVLSYFEDF